MNTDLLILGSGVAGLTAAIRAAALEPGMRVAVVTKGRLSDSATQWAQGGVAAVLHAGDSFGLHVADTLAAGAGLCDRSAVETLVAEGPGRLRALAALGAAFDEDTQGRWELAREGGHSTARVVHAGGAATGAEIERALVAAAGQAATVREHCFVTDLLTADGRCRGARLADGTVIHSAHTLLATGGAGQLFSVTTNPRQATGDGLAMALRAGVAVADVEFVQFHPTALHGPAGEGPRPLLSEALRGEGALLRDGSGTRFVDELQPRDVVAAAVAARIRETGAEHVWLDVSAVEAFEERFPTLAASARDAGLDPPSDWLPVAPAAHYICGGALTDLDGATTLPGLWAAGEVSCTGVHGANRLASNSLLEGLVYGSRVVEAVLGGKEKPSATGALAPLLEPAALRPGSVAIVESSTGLLPSRWMPETNVDDAKLRARLQRAMTAGAGVVRDDFSIDGAEAEVDAIARAGLPAGETANLLDVAKVLLVAARARRETRGGHRRSDYPEASAVFAHRLVQW